MPHAERAAVSSGRAVVSSGRAMGSCAWTVTFGTFSQALGTVDRLNAKDVHPSCLGSPGRPQNPGQQASPLAHSAAPLDKTLTTPLPVCVCCHHRTFCPNHTVLRVSLSTPSASLGASSHHRPLLKGRRIGAEGRSRSGEGWEGDRGLGNPYAGSLRGESSTVPTHSGQGGRLCQRWDPAGVQLS